MIEIEGVYKSFDKREILSDLNLKIADGDFFGLVGINGAGKSTLLRLLSGVLKPDKGRILIDGENVFDNENVKSKLFFLPDDPYYTIHVTANDLKALYQTYYTRFNEAKFKEYLDRFKLAPNKSIASFSKGMKRQLFIAIAISVEPQYLFLDEAFDGLDPLAKIIFKQAITELKTNFGTTVIISSHSLRELDDVCLNYGLIDNRSISSSKIIDEKLPDTHKFQVAFDRDVAETEIPFECKNFEKVGHLIRIVANGNGEELLAKLNTLSPIFVEELKMDFEELFTCEVESRGYLK